MKDTIIFTISGGKDYVTLDRKACEAECKPFNCSYGLMGCSGRHGEWYTRKEAIESCTDESCTDET
jgi:hypothetical protein